jgi:hypothetical protein
MPWTGVTASSSRRSVSSAGNSSSASSKPQSTSFNCIVSERTSEATTKLASPTLVHSVIANDNRIPRRQNMMASGQFEHGLPGTANRRF